MIKNKLMLPALLALILPLNLAAQSVDPGVYIILDVSGSMWGKLPSGTHKIVVARDVLN